MPVLVAGNLLHFLCVHGSKHLWTPLVWVCDVADLLSGRSDLAAECRAAR
jgi:hypothetical protein